VDTRLTRLVAALGPVMNPIQAEGFLHVTAFTCRKSLETLSVDDWPKIEAAVREALAHHPSAEEVDLVVDRLRDAFLEAADGADC